MDSRNTVSDFITSDVKITMSKRVVILGAGESGTGAAILAKAKGYDVFVSDQSAIKEQYKSELNSHAIAFEEGLHTEDKITNASLIIKSPGIPDKAEIIKKAKSKGIPIIDELEFAFLFLTGKVIAITGTNGKTTTTLLTYHLLKSAGFSVALAGNVGESLARKIAHEHRAYVPLLGLLFAVSLPVRFKLMDSAGIRGAIVVLAVVILFFGLSFQHIDHFRDRESYVTNAMVPSLIVVLLVNMPVALGKHKLPGKSKSTTGAAAIVMDLLAATLLVQPLSVFTVSVTVKLPSLAY